MVKPQRHQPNLWSLNAGVRLSIVLWLLGMGPALLPVYAESSAMGSASAITASVPIAKPQLFVNSSTGNDDLNAGRNESTPFKTIAYALQQAKSGTLIQVASGLYSAELGETFPLIVPQGVTLQGSEVNQGSNVTIMGGGFYSSSWWGSQNIAILAKSDSQVIGLTVTNPNSRGTGVWIESANATIRGCTFTKSAREGVFAAGKASPTIENSLFIENSANGVALTGMSTGIVRNSTFQRTGFGIAVSETASPQLVNNRIQDNVDGVVVSHSASPHLRGNLIEGSKRDGLVAISDAKPDLGSQTAPGRNIFRNNARYAVYNATLKNTLAVEGNDITGNMQLVAHGSTSVDQNAPPELQTLTSSNAQPMAATPIANKQTVSVAPKVGLSGSAPASKAIASTKLKQDLANAPTVKYKGKTYVLLEDVVRSAQ